MTLKQYDSEALQRYREKVVEISELRQQVGASIGEVDLEKARAEMDELTLRTEELTHLRATLEPKDLFMAKYNVTVLDEHTVSFVIPKGCSRSDMLQEAAELATGPIDVTEGLPRWHSNPLFLNPMEQATKVCICGHVAGSTGLTRSEQEGLLRQRGLRAASMPDLITAFVVFGIATQEPFFGWYHRLQGISYRVRASERDTGARLYVGRLYVTTLADERAEPFVAVSAIIE